MKVVCSFRGGAGHLRPMLPLVRAMIASGSRITIVGRESGLSADVRAIAERVVVRPDRRMREADTIAPLAPLDIAHELAVVERHFAGPSAIESADLVGPELDGADLVVCDELDFGAIGAARRAGVPVAVVAVIVTGALVRPDAITPALEKLAARLGPDVRIDPRGDVFIVPFPSSLRDPGHPDPPDALVVRPDTGAPRAEGAERIVATLGTEFNTESGDLFDRLLGALEQIPVPSVLAIGRDLDPARFGRRPSHLRIVRHVDLAPALAGADIAVHHGGSGLCTAAVMAGCPQLVLPMGADQPFTASAVERLGIGRSLDAVAATAEDIRAVIMGIRADVRIRARAGEIRAEALALPPVETILPRLEALRR